MPDLSLPPFDYPARSFSKREQDFITQQSYQLWPGLELALNHDQGTFRFLADASHCSPEERAWFEALELMARRHWSARLLVFEAREVEAFLRHHPAQPLWKDGVLPASVGDFDRHLRRTLAGCWLRDQGVTRWPSPASEGTLVEEIECLQAWLAHLFPAGEVSLVALEKNFALNEELDRVALTVNKHSLWCQLFGEQELVELLAELNSEIFAPRKWVAEPD